jgi:hypothetical protein
MNLEDFKNIDVPFDALQLPSMGLFYSSRTSTLYVKYVTAKEENILTQPSLMDNGFGLDLVLDSVVINKEVSIDDLLVGDMHSLMVYLRSTSYGDKFPLVTTCPSCSVSAETSFNLSTLGAKEMQIMPDEHGYFEFWMPKMKINGEKVIIRFRPLRIRDEREINEAITKERNAEKAYTSTVTLRFEKQIVSINGIEDKQFIRKMVKKFPLRDSSELRNFMEQVEPGIDSKIEFTCNNCSHTYHNTMELSSSIFQLDPSYKSNLWEEVFLIWYYGKGVNRSDIYNMSTVERRWSLQRISEEIEKRNQAEQAAYDKAKR